MAPRERSIEEAFEGIDRLNIHVRRLEERFDNLPFVRADLHNEQIAYLRNDIAAVRKNLGDEIAAVRTMQMWVLGLLGSILIAAVIAIITAVARGGVG